MAVNVGSAGLNQPAFIILDSGGNVVRSHNLTFSATPTNNADALIMAINSRYRIQREVALTNGGMLIVMSIV